MRRTYGAVRCSARLPIRVLYGAWSVSRSACRTVLVRSQNRTRRAPLSGTGYVMGDCGLNSNSSCYSRCIFPLRSGERSGLGVFEIYINFKRRFYIRARQNCFAFYSLWWPATQRGFCAAVFLMQNKLRTSDNLILKRWSSPKTSGLLVPAAAQQLV